MENIGNVNLREGIAGSFDFGELHDRMQRLNGQAGNGTNVQTRKAARVVCNPGHEPVDKEKPGMTTYADGDGIRSSANDGKFNDSAFVEGDRIGVSSYAGRSYNVSNAAHTSFGESITMNPSSESVADVEENAWSSIPTGIQNSSYPVPQKDSVPVSNVCESGQFQAKDAFGAAQDVPIVQSATINQKSHLQ
nr:hypothetical protein [Tanacetum cinerariifolium]